MPESCPTGGGQGNTLVSLMSTAVRRESIVEGAEMNVGGERREDDRGGKEIVGMKEEKRRKEEIVEKEEVEQKYRKEGGSAGEARKKKGQEERSRVGKRRGRKNRHDIKEKIQ